MKILVVDDHPIIRVALSEALRGLGTPVEVVEARTGAEAVSRASEHPSWDLVLLDLGLPDCDGFTVLGALRASHPSVPVVVFSAADDPRTVTRAINAGAMGFIPKTSSSAGLVNAIRVVLDGEVYLPASVLAPHDRVAPCGAGLTESRGDRAALVLQRLTVQQKRVLSYLMQGMPNKVISTELEKVTGRPIAVATVKAHVSAVINGLDVSSRTQAVIRATALGIHLADLLDSPGNTQVRSPVSLGGGLN